MKRTIIGLVGFKGSGKDTVGNILQEEFYFDRTSFADPLKLAVANMFGWSSDMLQGVTEESRRWREEQDNFWSKEFNRQITPRKILTEFGTEVVRKRLHSDFWTIRCKQTILQSQNDIVVTDLRFKNEIELIKNLGGKIVWVKRGPLPEHYNQSLWWNRQCRTIQYITKPFLGKMKNIHLSEREWIGTKFDFVIENDSSIEDLRKNIYNLYDLFY